MRRYRGLVGAIAILVMLVAVWSFSSSVFAAQLGGDEPIPATAASAPSEAGASAGGAPDGFPISRIDIALALGGGVLFVGTGALLVTVLPRVSARRRTQLAGAVAGSTPPAGESRSAPIGLS